jgi:hypothetical protein
VEPAIGQGLLQLWMLARVSKKGRILCCGNTTVHFEKLEQEEMFPFQNF